MNGPNRTEGARPWLGRTRKARKAGCRVKPGMTGWGWKLATTCGRFLLPSLSGRGWGWVRRVAAVYGR